jgi:hypothetical protein
MEVSPLDNHIKVKLRRMHGASRKVKVRMYSQYFKGESRIDLDGDGILDKRPQVVDREVIFDEF